jgi:hypothetical protein
MNVYVMVKHKQQQVGWDCSAQPDKRKLRREVWKIRPENDKRRDAPLRGFPNLRDWRLRFRQQGWVKCIGWGERSEPQHWDDSLAAALGFASSPQPMRWKRRMP